MVVLGARAETVGELPRGEVTAVNGAGRVVEFAKEAVEFGLVAQGQANVQVQALGRREGGQGPEEGNDGGDVAREDLRACGQALKGESESKGGGQRPKAERKPKIENRNPKAQRGEWGEAARGCLRAAL